MAHRDSKQDARAVSERRAAHREESDAAASASDGLRRDWARAWRWMDRPITDEDWLSTGAGQGGI